MKSCGLAHKQTISQQQSSSTEGQCNNLSAKSLITSCGSVKQYSPAPNHDYTFSESLSMIASLKENQKSYEIAKAVKKYDRRKEKNHQIYQNYIEQKKKTLKQQQNCIMMVMALKNIIRKHQKNYFQAISKSFSEQSASVPVCLKENSKENCMKIVLFSMILRNFKQKQQKSWKNQFVNKIKHHNRKVQSIESFGRIFLLFQQRCAFRNFAGKVEQNFFVKTNLPEDLLFSAKFIEQSQRIPSNVEAAEKSFKNEQILKLKTSISSYSAKIEEMHDLITRKLTQKYNKEFAESSYITNSDNCGLSFDESQLYADLIGAKCHRELESDGNRSNMKETVQQYFQKCQSLQQKVDCIREKCEQILYEMRIGQNSEQDSNCLLLKALLALVKPM